MAIELIDKIKPKNGGDFPLVDAEDVLMPDGKRLKDFKGGVTSVNGQTGDVQITVTNGKDGKDGANGVSPTVKVSKSGKVTTITITDATGTHTATINDGTNGTNGTNGADGYTPVRGVDYFNEEDIHVIKSYIDSLFVPVTQEEYDALVAAGTMDANKYYMIVG